MRTTVIIQDLTCNDCRSGVLDAFDKFEGITNIVADTALGSLSFDYRSHNVLEGLRLFLKELGHTITSDPNIIKAFPTSAL